MRAGERYAFLSNREIGIVFKPLLIFIPFLFFLLSVFLFFRSGVQCVYVGAGAMEGAKRPEGHFYGVIPFHPYVSSGAQTQVTGLAWHLYLLSHPNGPLF